MDALLIKYRFQGHTFTGADGKLEFYQLPYWVMKYLKPLINLKLHLNKDITHRYQFNRKPISLNLIRKKNLNQMK